MIEVNISKIRTEGQLAGPYRLALRRVAGVLKINAPTDTDNEE